MHIPLRTNTFKCLRLGWSNTGDMINARDEHTSSVLTNGKVIATDGYNNDTFLSNTELY
jgi:hypothetical protein